MNSSLTGQECLDAIEKVKKYNWTDELDRLGQDIAKHKEIDLRHFRSVVRSDFAHKWAKTYLYRQWDWQNDSSLEEKFPR